jgi:hypothetical protein
MDRVRKLPWLPAALVAAVLVTALALGACGEEEKKVEGAEGEFIEVGGADYQVQLTRLLNPEQRPDDAFLRGQPKLPPEEAYLAVFVRIENDGDEPHQPPRDMKIIDTQGNEYLPLGTAQSDFGLDFGTPIEPDGVAPPPDSPGSFSPTSGAMILFRVKLDSATNNLPLVLEIPVEGEEEPSRITLDV